MEAYQSKAERVAALLSKTTVTPEKGKKAGKRKRAKGKGKGKVGTKGSKAPGKKTSRLKSSRAGKSGTMKGHLKARLEAVADPSFERMQNRLESIL